MSDWVAFEPRERLQHKRNSFPFPHLWSSVGKKKMQMFIDLHGTALRNDVISYWPLAGNAINGFRDIQMIIL